MNMVASDPYLAQRRLPLWRQERLAASTALVVGIGGLGLPAAMYLAAMGIGHLILCDPDTVAVENLHRQPLYHPTHIGQLKVSVLQAFLEKLRPDLAITTYAEWTDEDFLRKVGSKAHIWIDGTDNLDSRLRLDAVAQELGKPWVYGAIYQWEGQAALWHGQRYVDYFGYSEAGLSCAEGGVLGAIPGIIGAWQAALAASFLSDPATAPIHRLFRIDLLRGEAQSFALGPASERAALEIDYATAKACEPTWVDMREDPEPTLPLQTVRLPWYTYDAWTLPNGPIVLICETGTKSRQVAFALRAKLKRQDIYSLKGGALSLPKGAHDPT